MKKFLAIVLSVLCIFSVFAVSVSADFVDDITGLMTEIGSDDPVLYSVTYKKETLSDVKVMYFPIPSLSFDGPGTIKVTNDTPIAIDHDFVCWKDKKGTYYYPGDEFYVNGECELYPVWEEKKDNNSHALRVIKAALSTFMRGVQKVLGIFKAFDDFNKDYFSSEASTTESTSAVTTTTAAPTPVEEALE